MQEKTRLTARMLRSENVTRVTRCKIKEKAESTQTLVCCEQPVPIKNCAKNRVNEFLLLWRLKSVCMHALTILK